MAVLLAPNVSFIPTESPRDFINPDLSAARWGMEELNERLANYGYGGIELHWARVFKHCLELRFASPQQAQDLARGIESAHEGWRGVADPQPFNPALTPYRTDREPEGLKEKVAGALLLPTGSGSLRALRRVERKLDLPQPWHYVMFPDQNGNYRKDVAKTTLFPDSSIQPTTDVEACWNAPSPEEFVGELAMRGYKATLDSFHISRRGKVVETTSNWEALMSRLLKEKMVREVHISPGRQDFAAIDPKRYGESVAELKALEANRSLETTPLGRFADLLNSYKWTGNVALETTIPGLTAAFGALTADKLAEIHRNLTAGVKQLLPHITWESKFTTTQA